jgi:hypothetical protein
MTHEEQTQLAIQSNKEQEEDERAKKELDRLLDVSEFMTSWKITPNSRIDSFFR